jgi:hypothetical protein
MNTPFHPSAFSSSLGPEQGLRRQAAGLAAKAWATVLILACLTGTSLAIDQPPDTAPQQRAWLLSRLVTDMQRVGSFTSDDVARTVTLVNALTDDRVSLLARFYCLTREKTEQDARLYAVQLSDTEEALARAKAQVADLLTQEHNRIEQTYSELATINPGCQTLCQVTYASVPGWCAYNRYAIPDWYYGNGCYVGPVFSAGYCGAYAVPVYGAFYDRGSRYNYWNSRAYVHNNVTGITRTHGSSIATGTRCSHPKSGHAVAVPTKYHAQAAGLNRSVHSAAMRNAAMSLKQPKTNHSRPVTARHAPQPRSVGHSQSHAQRNHVVHAQPRHQQPGQGAHAHPQHVAHAQTHPQHVAHHAQARSQSGHARHG